MLCSFHSSYSHSQPFLHILFHPTFLYDQLFTYTWPMHQVALVHCLITLHYYAILSTIPKLPHTSLPAQPISLYKLSLSTIWKEDCSDSFPVKISFPCINRSTKILSPCNIFHFHPIIPICHFLNSSHATVLFFHYSLLSANNIVPHLKRTDSKFFYFLLYLTL